ncbi:MAG: glycosyltransferase family 2 protein [Gammaproteobacteria bacterium]|nr:glycosyltransferase family 2 protein [Gammaproteobacteria bacterium]
MSTSKSISIVIPVRNEAGYIAAQLQRLQAYRSRGHELIVIDGGSLDDTVQLTTGLVDSCESGESGESGRSRQMNQGAASARGDVLLFLHADTELPEDADGLIIEALAEQGSRWGWFDVRLSNSGLPYRMVGGMMNLRSRLTSVCTGDQALFVERALFEELGGFPALELMEDIALSKALRRATKAEARPARPDGVAVTSSRRWEQNGLLTTILLMWKLRLLYFFGMKPSNLVRMYYPRHD